MTPHRRSALLSFAVVLLLTTLTAAQSTERVVERELDLRSAGRLSVKNANGTISVAGRSGDGVRLRAVIRARGRNGAESVERTRIRIEGDDDDLSIVTDTPRGEGFFSGWFGGSASVSVDYVLEVPEHCQLRLSNTNGRIHCEAVRGSVRLESTNGRISARGIGGRFQAHTTNGAIDASLLSLADGEPMELTTTNGAIELDLPAEAAFSVDAATTNGGIRTDFPLTVEGRYGSRRLSGDVNGGGPRLFIETTNGSIRLNRRG